LGCLIIAGDGGDIWPWQVATRAVGLRFLKFACNRMSISSDKRRIRKIHRGRSWFFGVCPLEAFARFGFRRLSRRRRQARLPAVWDRCRPIDSLRLPIVQEAYRSRLVAFAAVDDIAGLGQVGHLFQGKGISQHVLSEDFQTVMVVPLNAMAGVDAESAVMPLSHLFRLLGGELSLFREELEQADAKQFGDLFPSPFMQGAEGMRADKGAVRYEDMQMRVVV